MNSLIEQEEGTFQGVQAHDSKQFPACDLCRYFQNPLHGRLKPMDGTEINRRIRIVF